jgi:hypothetical protein
MPAKPSTAHAILTGGLIVGTLDISAAALQTLQAGGTVTRLLQYVASGAFGKAAFDGGWKMAACGLLFHYLIAFSFTVGFFLLYPRVSLLAKSRLLTGLGYGLVVWAVMNLVVVPISVIGWRGFDLARAAMAAGILVVCIGMPLSFLAYRHYVIRK